MNSELLLQDFDCWPLAILCYSEEGRISYANLAFAQALGLDDLNKVYDKSPDQLLQLEGVEDFYAGKHLSQVSFSSKVSDKNGAGEIRIQKLKQGWCLTLNPINSFSIQLDEKEQELLQTSKIALMGELVKEICHELNNPLSIVSGSVEVMQTLLDGETQDIKMFSQLVDYSLGSCKRMLRMSRQLNRLGRYSAGDRYSQKMDIKNVLVDAACFVGPMMRRNGISLDTQVAENLPRLDLDSEMIEQVAIHMLKNSCDAFEEMEDRPKEMQITIRAQLSSSGEVLVISFEDNGSGMSPETQKHIFSPFFTSKGVARGTGLGVSMSAMIARHAGGELKVESQQGKGTCFSLILPLPAAKDESQDRGEGLKGLKLLVAEPDPKVRTVIFQMLEGRGLQIVEAPDQKTAKEFIRTFSPDIVLTSLYKLKKCGDSVKNKSSTLWVLLLTEDSDKDESKGHFDQVLSQPFSIDQILAIMNKAAKKDKLLEDSLEEAV